MLILRCDRCGHEETHSQIVGNEYKRLGFETLAEPAQTKGIKDVCAKCFKIIDKARKEIFEADKKSKWDKFKAVIAPTKPESEGE